MHKLLQHNSWQNCLNVYDNRDLFIRMRVIYNGDYCHEVSLNLDKVLDFSEQVISRSESQYLIYNQTKSALILYNLGRNFYGLFCFLAQLFCTISKTKLNYYHEKVNVQVPSQVPERITTKDLRKFQENPWNPWIWLQVPSHPPKSQILTFFGKNLQKIICKTFHRKT